ncbi:hypothetical protein HNY73_014963 [Argiope bruennichi]|uniref:Uncharacterized protein n=1 Tax=Argiope bruennichi TaxID=94029 RepID=A0A8T0ES69_ARGBR|nr:hypothetical protein HNY73_014963 [Argiope bruennichi]
MMQPRPATLLLRPTTVLGVPSLSVTKALPHRRPDTLRVEAFLDKTAPTLEGNVAIVKNMVNCARVRRILDNLGSEASRSRVRVLKGWKNPTTINGANTRKNCCSLSFKWQRRKACARIPPLDPLINDGSTDANGYLFNE